MTPPNTAPAGTPRVNSTYAAKRGAERISTRTKKLLNVILDDEIAADKGKAEIKALDAQPRGRSESN